MRRWIVAVLGVMLSGCLPSLPPAEQVKVAAPSGMTLPLPGRVLVFIAQADLDRLFSYDLNRQSAQKTDVREGAALDAAARTVLGKAFAVAETNRADIRPHVVARVTGKAVWNRVDNTFRVVCELDATDADGMPIGHFPNVYKSPSLIGFEANLPLVYAQCLRPAVEQLLASPDVVALARAGFPEPDPVKSAIYLRSQGFVVR